MDRFIRIALSTDTEIGGLLIGRIVGVYVKVKKIVIGKNIYDSPTRSELDPASMAKAINEMDDEEDIVGIMHAHPAPPFPSLLDKQGMKLWPIIWVIIDSNTGEYRAWFFDTEINITPE